MSARADQHAPSGHVRPVILVTSFEPFGGSAVNPTIEITRQLATMPCAVGARVYATLPVVTGDSHGSAWATLAPLLAILAPDAVVSLGESAKAECVVFERVAINLRDARIADNAGTQLRDASVIERAPDAYFTTLPLRAMLDACVASGVEAEFSLSAGTFLCNEIMFRTLHDAINDDVARLSGFVHVPQLPEQAAARGGPSMDANASARGVHAALEQLAIALARLRAEQTLEQRA